MRTRIAILSVLALAGCDLEATAEADEVCVTETTNRTVPGSPVGGVVGEIAVEQLANITLDVDAAIPDLDDRGVSGELIARSITLRTVQDVDLSGIEALVLTVEATGRPPVAFRYQRPPGAAAPILALVTVPDRPVDLVEYVEGTNRLRISSVSVRGSPPSAAWTPILRTCASAKVKVDYVEAAR